MALMIAEIRRAIPTALKPLTYLRHLVEWKTRDRVRDGPFKGQKIAFHGTLHSSYVPKVLGIYERELHDIVDEICKRAPHTIVNIGAGDGYYTIGFSQRIPSVTLIAFEADERARANLARNAAVNRVEGNISIRASCGTAELRESLQNTHRPTIVCDVEGYEAVLLDPTSIVELHNADILVEIHDFIVPGVSKLIQNRFSASHEIVEIEQKQRSVKDFPWRTPLTVLIPNRYLELIVSEGRPAITTWLWMKARYSRCHWPGTVASTE